MTHTLNLGCSEKTLLSTLDCLWGRRRARSLRGLRDRARHGPRDHPRLHGYRRGREGCPGDLFKGVGPLNGPR